MKKAILILAVLVVTIILTSFKTSVTEKNTTTTSTYDTENYLGEIKLFPYNFVPRGWEKCNGQELLINQNQALFSLLGTTYGGDGRTTFAMPKLDSPLKFNKTKDKILGYYCINVQGIFPSRK